MSHVGVVDWSPAWSEQFRAVRDVLRRRDDLLDAYAEVKLALHRLDEPAPDGLTKR